MTKTVDWLELLNGRILHKEFKQNDAAIYDRAGAIYKDNAINLQQIGEVNQSKFSLKFASLTNSNYLSSINSNSSRCKTLIIVYSFFPFVW